MSAEHDNIELVRRVYERFSQGDIPGVLGSLAAGVKWCVPDMENVPYAGCRYGPEAVGEFFAALGAVQDIRSFELRRVMGQDDTVVALGHYGWQVKSTGRDFEVEWVHVFTAQNGSITCFQEYFDTSAVIAAFRPG